MSQKSRLCWLNDERSGLITQTFCLQNNCAGGDPKRVTDELYNFDISTPSVASRGMYRL